jgi:hypothetical protein
LARRDKAILLGRIYIFITRKRIRGLAIFPCREKSRPAIHKAGEVSLRMVSSPADIEPQPVPDGEH